MSISQAVSRIKSVNLSEKAGQLPKKKRKWKIVMDNNTLKSVSIRRQNNDKSKERNRKWCKQYYENNKERLQS